MKKMLTNNRAQEKDFSKKNHHVDFFVNKKAQVGETTTWLVATLIILFIITMAIFSLKLGFNPSENKIRFSYYDSLVQKSSMSFLLSKSADGQKVFDVLRNSEAMNPEEEKLGSQIFSEKKDDFYLFITFDVGTGILSSLSNYLTKDVLRGDVMIKGFDQRIFISENKFFKLGLYFPND